MTIDEAIKWLQKLREQHGNLAVYFDCPSCQQSFTPGPIVTKAIVITGEKKAE
jgi:hypothetical protein